MAALDNLRSGRGLFGLTGAAADRADRRALRRAQGVSDINVAAQEGLQADERARAGAADAQLAQSLSGAPGPFAAGMFPQPGLSPEASQPTNQRTIQDFLAAGGSPEQAVGIASLPQQREAAAEAAIFDANNKRQVALNIWRDDIRTDLSGSAGLNTAAGDARSLLQLGTSVGDQGAITKVAKVLDPESVVRGAEVDAILGGMGAQGWLELQYNKLGGKAMEPPQRLQFQNMIDSLVGAAAIDAMTRLQAYTDGMARAGFEQADIDNTLKQSGVDEKTLLNMINVAAPYLSDDQTEQMLVLLGG